MKAATITDDDLKRLKEISESFGIPTHEIGKHKLKALLARLETADALAALKAKP